MPILRLDDAKLRSLKTDKIQADYWDENLPGFGVRVSKSGSKVFMLNVHNSRRSLGKFGIVTLSEARTEAKRIIAERTLGKVRPQSITYEQAVKLFLEEKGERRRARTVKDHTRHLNLLGFKGQLADVSHSDLERKLKRLSPSEFNHRLSCAKTFFTWAQRKRYITENPVIGLSAHPTKARSRVLTDDELKRVWTACEKPSTDLPAHYRAIVRLLITTGQRKGEIAALRADFFKDDLCTLPESLTKNGREHQFPIAPLAKFVLKSLTNASSTAFLFPARGGSGTCFNGWSKSKAALDKLAKIPPWTLHDLRRTYRSNLARLGIAPHIAERLVNHVSSRTRLEEIYDQYKYLPEMREAQTKYENWLHQLLQLA